MLVWCFKLMTLEFKDIMNTPRKLEVSKPLRSASLEWYASIEH